MKKNFSNTTPALALIPAVVLVAAKSHAQSPRDQAFDSNWHFLRGDAADAQNPAFNDSRWRTLDVPHDWSIEDLPPLADAVPELAAVAGRWRFQKGDDASWKARDLDDASWQEVALPSTWESHSNYTQDNTIGWFRRRIAIPPSLKNRDFDLMLGRIDDADEAWFNGVRIGGSGSFPPRYQTAYDVVRRYRVPASLVRGDGSDTIAVRVFDGEKDGGIYDAGTKAARIGPFDPAESTSKHFTGNTVGGIGWYRKSFTLREVGKKVAVRFDGVYMNAEFWINGQRLGEHPSGYTSFEFDLTPHLRPAGQPNVLAVRVRNEGRNTRWYAGSGLYRHVWLSVREPVHVPTWGVFVSTPEASRARATVKIASEVRNDLGVPAQVRVRVRLLDASGKAVGATQSTVQMPAQTTRSVESSLQVLAPRLWSVSAPNLYRAQVEVAVGKRRDVASTTFGIRKIEVDAVRGFRLNGEPMKLKGGCVHHDNGPLGAAAIDRAEERKVELMKAQGYNALRTSHNPPSPALLEACDRLGMLVIDEAFDQWDESKENNAQDYHRFFNAWSGRDIASMVRRDRNHPSVIMWSIGNEIPEQFRAEATQKRLRESVLSHDPTRLITQAIHRQGDWERASDAAFKYLDVGGYNYLPDKYEADHARHPERVMMGTESYPKDAFEYWDAVEKHPYIIGDFVWTALDYLGEAGIGHAVLSNQADSFFMPWPYFNAWCGDIDLTGAKKPQSLLRDVVWRRSPLEMTVHAPIPPGLTEKVSAWGFPDERQSWNWAGHEGTPLQVSVYSRCERVRLELNGKLIGEQPISEATKLVARFEVPYSPGELRAIGLSGGKVVAQKAIRTSGATRKLRLVADRTRIRASRNDLSYVAVEVVDERGQLVPDAQVLVRFSVSGAGELAAQANASPNEPASFRAPARETFRGRALAILRPKGGAGRITLRAEAEGLEAASVTVQVRQY